jgi:hypothetical protein
VIDSELITSVSHDRIMHVKLLGDSTGEVLIEPTLCVDPSQLSQFFIRVVSDRSLLDSDVRFLGVLL